MYPAWRPRPAVLGFWGPTPVGRLDGAAFAAAAAAGFGLAHGAHELWQEPTAIRAIRVALSMPAHLFFASTPWGYALGAAPLPLRRPGLQRHLALRHRDERRLRASSSRGARPLLALVPIVAAMGFFAAGRELPGRPDAASSRRRLLPSIALPSIRAMREALAAHRAPGDAPLDRARRSGDDRRDAAVSPRPSRSANVGIDFAAVDRGDTAGSAPPLVLIGAAVLGAFPLAGYLVARASATRTVLSRRWRRRSRSFSAR